MDPNAHLEAITYRPVGVVRSPFTRFDGMPLQSVAAKETSGRVEVRAELQPGLRDLDGFSHLHLITHLHRGRPGELEVVPFLDDTVRGIFATRSPATPTRSESRSSASSLSRVRLLRSWALTCSMARRCSISNPTCRCSTAWPQNAPAGSRDPLSACTMSKPTRASTRHSYDVGPIPPAANSLERCPMHGCICCGAATGRSTRAGRLTSSGGSHATGPASPAATRQADYLSSSRSRFRWRTEPPPAARRRASSAYHGQPSSH